MCMRVRVQSAYRLLEFSWSEGHSELVVRVMFRTRWPVVLGFSFFALASWRLLLLHETQVFENTFVPLDVGESLELIWRQVRSWIICGIGGFGGGVGSGVKESIERIVCVMSRRHFRARRGRRARQSGPTYQPGHPPCPDTDPRAVLITRGPTSPTGAE